MSRETLRGLLIVAGIALIATAFWGTYSRISGAVFGALGLVFICLLWYFGYNWYRENRMAISLMPDRQRNIMYAGMGAATVAAAVYSLAKFGLVSVGGLTVTLLVIIFLAGLFGMFYAWQESKRYYL
ncbi:MAG: hypothetical protein ACXVY5_02640 [Gaiellales bacterium]